MTLMEFARRGTLNLENVIAERIPLDADAINDRLDALDEFHGKTRTVIMPTA